MCTERMSIMKVWGERKSKCKSKGVNRLIVYVRVWRCDRVRVWRCDRVRV